MMNARLRLWNRLVRIPTAFIALVALGSLLVGTGFMGLGPAPTASAADLKVTFSAPAQAMAYVPVTFKIATVPAVNAIAQIQIATTAGWVKTTQVSLNSQGSGTGTISSNNAGKRDYRAVIISRTNGKVLGRSARITITWAPLKYSVSLACSKSTAPIRVRVPCSIAVSPTVRMTGLAAQLQVRGRTSWVSMAAWSVPTNGKISATVEGFEPGLGNYRVRLLRSGALLTTSNTVSVSWTAPIAPPG